MVNPASGQWYDRSGRPIPAADAQRLLATPGYDRVRCVTVLDMGDLDWIRDVATVWLGMDLAGEAHVPMIFETAVFDRDHELLESRRHATEADAVAVHERLVAAACAEAVDPVVLDTLSSP